MNRKFIFLSLLFVFSSLALGCWFDPSDTPGEPSRYGKVIITRVNTFETYPKNSDVFSTNSSDLGIEFFDYGDTNKDITLSYGGDTNHPFSCAWPITFCVWYQTNWGTEAQGNGYKETRLQYCNGSNANNLTTWYDIAVITDFTTLNSVNGAHFGLVTWMPPNTNNVFYLVRVWAELNSTWYNAPTNTTDPAVVMNKDGTIGGAPLARNWDDYEVVLIKSIPQRKAGGFKEIRNPNQLGNPSIDDFPQEILTNNDNQPVKKPKSSFFRFLWSWLFSD